MIEIDGKSRLLENNRNGKDEVESDHLV